MVKKWPKSKLLVILEFTLKLQMLTSFLGEIINSLVSQT